MQTRTILLVDDDESTRIFTRFALKHLEGAPLLQYVPNGLEATYYLQGCGRFTDRGAYPLPDLILLDLKMPVMDGFQFLDWLGSQAVLCKLPVVMLTGSSYQPDIRRAYQLGAAGFIEKSADLGEFEAALKEILGIFICQSHCELYGPVHSALATAMP